MTDNEVIAELGARLRALRIGRDLSIADLAERARLNYKTVQGAESGGNPRLGTVVRLLRVLGRLGALETFVPPVTISPLDAVARGAMPRKRVAKRG